MSNRLWLALCFPVLSCIPLRLMDAVESVHTGVQRVHLTESTLTQQTGALKVQVCPDSIIRVTYSPTASFPQQNTSSSTKASWTPSNGSWTPPAQDVTITTARLKIGITRKDRFIPIATLREIS